MCRALVLAGVMLAGLLALVPALATTASARLAEREVERELIFAVPAEGGFRDAVWVTNNDGDISATLIISKDHQVAYYSAPAKVTAKRVTARFGSLGELDFTFAPKPNGNTRCTGDEEGEATFEGTFAFTGENEYVHLEADRAEGSFQISPEPNGCRQTGRPRRAVPYRPSYSDEGATLRARAGSPQQGVIREIDVYDAGGRGLHRVGVSAFLAEEREGMSVQRGVSGPARSDAFSWSLAKGTATLRPPAPFTGSAHFVRHGNNGHGTWTGSLSMPILGGEPVELAGSAFRAFIHKGVPQGE